MKTAHKGGRGVRQMLTVADKGGGGSQMITNAPFYKGVWSSVISVNLYGDKPMLWNDRQ